MVILCYLHVRVAASCHFLITSVSCVLSNAPEVFQRAFSKVVVLPIACASILPIANELPDRPDSQCLSQFHVALNS